jgi:dipeptidyl aminopeptidase/acylaminoacyl peptidase
MSRRGSAAVPRWLKGAAIAAVAAWQAAFAAPPPIEHFTKQPTIYQMVPSPSGDRIAVLVSGNKGRRQLGVLELPPKAPIKAVAGFSDADIMTVRWVNDDRLVFEAYQDGPVISEGGAGTFAIDRDGTNQRQLISWRHTNPMIGTNIRTRVLKYGWFLHSTLDDGSADVLIYQKALDSLDEARELQLARLNTLTGELRNLSTGMPSGAWNWLLDEKREPRVVGAPRDGRYKVHWRAPGSSNWMLLENFDGFDDDGTFRPWFVEEDNQLLVGARVKRDASALYAYDLKTRKLNPEPLVAVAGFDLEPTLEVDSKSRRLVGVHFRTDRPQSYWFDPQLQGLQKALDGALPKGRVNRLLCGRCETARFVVIESRSDRQPGEYYLFDRTERTLASVGKSRPWLDETAQGHRTFHRVATRDGLSMPVYVTHPAGAAPTDALPAVVLVHGGPYVRGADILWDTDAQFLASRGYRVIEPEFRGTTGYGYELFRAGWKEWGHAMQDDLADAVQWAAKEKLIDGSRVCVMGASYGGYAALMAPIRHPALYKCAVSYAGVADIELMYKIHWSDISEQAKRYGMPKLIGDPEKDAARLREASPLRRVEEIKVPILLAHGGLDARVPMEHARKFISAARRAGVTVEDVIYGEEGHGWFYPANQTDFFSRVEKFLARSLAPAPR